MILLCTQTDNTWLNGVTEYFFAPIVVAFVAYYGFGKFEERKNHKMNSLLGVEILTMLMQEVETGIDFLNKSIGPDKTLIHNSLPHKCWNGINTISDDILLRIFVLSKKLPDDERNPKQIRIFTKNYFDIIIESYEKVCEDMYITHKGEPISDKNLKFVRHITVESGKVLEMLRISRSLLEKNAKTLFPK